MFPLSTSLVALKAAARSLALLSAQEKNDALSCLADALWDGRESVLEANRGDVERARQEGMAAAMVDRLLLNETRWAAVVKDLRRVAELPDPVGKVLGSTTLPGGLQVEKVRVPLGVAAVIYESRPNVTVDVIGLALKSGNGVVLRGGKETLATNRAIMALAARSLLGTAVPVAAVCFIDDPDRDLVLQLLRRYDLVDVVIPRGGAGLHQFCRENSLIPVITGGIGICHLFVDESADLQRSIAVIRNAKVQRPTVCNALETLLVHERVASGFIPQLVDRLRQDQVVFYLDEQASSTLPAAPDLHPARPEDFDREWLSLTLGIRVVSGLEEAITHIELHGTGHSDGILTGDEEHARIFTSRVDSAAVYVNASTRFTDGSALGLGAEMAISTQKLHVRGPMALEELTTYKWIVRGDYAVRP